MQFLADIAGMLEIFAIAGGLVLLHRASKEPPAQLLRTAGWVLVVGGIVIGLCTAYYWLRYRLHGEFRSAHMGYPGMIYAPGAGMGPGMMGPGTMRPGMMTPGAGTMRALPQGSGQRQDSTR